MKKLWLLLIGLLLLAARSAMSQDVRYDFKLVCLEFREIGARVSAPMQEIAVEQGE